MKKTASAMILITGIILLSCYFCYVECDKWSIWIGSNYLYNNYLNRFGERDFCHIIKRN